MKVDHGCDVKLLVQVKVRNKGREDEKADGSGSGWSCGGGKTLLTVICGENRKVRFGGEFCKRQVTASALDPKHNRSLLIIFSPSIPGCRTSLDRNNYSTQWLHVVYGQKRIVASTRPISYITYENRVFTSFSRQREQMHSAQNAQAPACDHVCRGLYRIRRSLPRTQL